MIAGQAMLDFRLPHPEERELWEQVARVVEPRPLVRPSAWAEANVRLDQKQSPARPGPFRCDFLPWTRAIHDVMYENPGKQGVIAIKRAQIGFTRAVLNILACYCDTRPGPFLFITGDDVNARHYASAHFDPMVAGCPRLQGLFEQARSGPDRERDLMLEKPYAGGRVDFAGGGSPGRVSSRTYVVVALDEYEIVQDNFLARAGSPWGFAEARTLAVRDIAQRLVFSHPRTRDTGIWPLYERESDMRFWGFDCPHCAGVVEPAWSCIHITGLKDSGPLSIELGEIDPATAVFRCPCCGEVLTDGERARAVWPAELGGSGRFVSKLDPTEAARRPFVGLAINGLADPDTTVASLVDALMRCSSEVDRQTFFNLRLGQTYSSASAAITVEHVKDRIRPDDGRPILLPGGPLGVHYLCVGVDVQAPETNPTLYTRAEAYAATGTKFVTHMEKLRGWAALAEFLRLLSVEVSTPDGSGVGSKIGASLCSIDCGAWTDQVLDFCRQIVYSAEGGGRVQLLPLRYQAHVKSTAPAVLPSVIKRTDPARPWLGVQDRYDLHRDTWVDRELRRWQDGRVIVLCRPPKDLGAHMTANHQVPGPDVHGWGNPGLVWEKIKDARDDWMQAGAFCEAGAAIKLGLDRIHELATAPAEPEQAERERARADYFEARRGGRANYWGR